MFRLDVSHQPRAEKRCIESVMPRLSYEQMLAILRESGVPESDARRWVEREARLARDVSAGDG